LFFFYKGVWAFEISRIGPAVGGIVPLFTFLLIYLFTLIPLELGFEKRILSFREYLALILIILGSVILSLHRKKLATLKSLKISIIASFLFSLSFVLTKLVYTSSLPFWTGFIWIKLGNCLGAMSFLAFYEVRKGIFKHKGTFRKKIALTFAFAKVAGAIGGVLQHGAIFLAPLAFLPIINAMEGIKYIFLIILATLFFFKFPKIFKEEVSGKVLFQKIFAILLIGLGLALFSLF